ncbi:MAG: small subunit ribosomal protein [Verrucomicrobiota bacterium]|jgi:small subunit ribosomal protein S6|nr:small subunit ribosomal protein [Verrucomicrobiota bacterium]
MSQTKRNYKATFILDNRGKEDSVESIIEGVKKEITAVQGEVTAVENIGRREFARKTDDKFPGGVYVSMAFSAPAAAPAQLHERLRLNGAVYRALLENA